MRWLKLGWPIAAAPWRRYIQSSEKIRDRLLIGEWELARKQVAMRRQVCARIEHIISAGFNTFALMGWRDAMNINHIMPSIDVLVTAGV